MYNLTDAVISKSKIQLESKSQLIRQWVIFYAAVISKSKIQLESKSQLKWSSSADADGCNQ